VARIRDGKSNQQPSPHSSPKCVPLHLARVPLSRRTLVSARLAVTTV